MTRNVYFPIRLRLDPAALAGEGTEVDEALTTALGRAVAGARARLPADLDWVRHEPTLSWVGPDVARAAAGMQDAVEGNVLALVQKVANTAGIRAAPPRVAPPARVRRKRRWRVEVAKNFRMQLASFLGFCDGVLPFSADIPALYFDHWEDIIWCSAWTVRVEEALPIDELVEEVADRQSELAGFSPRSQRTVGVWSINDWVRRKLIQAAPAGSGLEQLPALRTYGYLAVQADGREGLQRGARVLFTLTLLPAIKWEEKVEERPSHVIQVPLRELRDLIDADRFQASHRVSWASYLHEFGSELVDVQFVPFALKSTTSFRALQELGRTMIAERVSSKPWFGGVYFLSEQAVRLLPAPLRRVAQQESFSAVWSSLAGAEHGVWARGAVGALIFLELPPDSSKRLQATYAALGRNDADALIAILGHDERPFWLGQRVLGFLRRYSLDGEQRSQFAFMLDELRTRDGGKWFVAFFKAVNDPEATFELPHRVIGLAAGYWYATDPELITTSRRLDARAKRGRQFAYAKDEIDLDKDGKRVMRPGDLFIDWNSLWSSKDEEQRLTKAALARFEKALEEQTLAVLIEMRSANPNEEHDLRDIGRKIFERAQEKTPLGKDDVEDVTYERTLLLKAVRPYVDHQLISYEISVAWVQREAGKAVWVPVNRTGGRFEVTSWDAHRVETKTSGELEERIFFFEFAHSARAINTASKIVTWSAVIVIAWEVGAVSFLVEIAGGWGVVGASIAISEAFYLISSAVSGEGLTLEGFLVAALVGYLGAFTFQLVGPAIGPWAKAVGARVGFNSLLRVVVGKLVERAIIGGAVGASTALLTTFTMDMINVALGGHFSSPWDYVKNAAKGMLFGALLECGVSGFGMLFRAQGLNALTTIAELASRIKLLKVRPGDLVSAGLQSLRKFREWLGIFKNGSELYRAITRQWQDLVTAVVGNVRASAFLRILELSENVQLSAAQGATLERLFLAMEGLTQESSVGIANILTRFGGRTELLLDAMGGLDDASLASLAKAGLLEELAVSPSSLAALRDAPEAALSALVKAFKLRVNELETFLADTAPFGSSEQLIALKFLGLTEGKIPAALIVRAMQGARKLSPEMATGLVRLFDRAGADLATKVLAKLAPSQIEPFLNLAQKLDAPVVGAAAKSGSLQALAGLAPKALAALTDAAGIVPAKILADFATRGLLPVLAESPQLLAQLRVAPDLVHVAFAGPFRGSIADIEAFLADAVEAGANGQAQLAALAFLNAAGARIPPDVVLAVLRSGKFTDKMAGGLLRLTSTVGSGLAGPLLKGAKPAHVEAFLELLRVLPDDAVQVLARNGSALSDLIAQSPEDLAAFAEVVPGIIGSIRPGVARTGPAALANAAQWADFSKVVKGAATTVRALGKDRAAPFFENMLSKQKPKPQVFELWQGRLSGAPELSNQPPLGRDSWIVDSQAVVGLNSPNSSNLTVRTVFDAWRAARTAAGVATDLRLTTTTIAEAGSLVGHPAAGVPLRVPRNDPQYLEMAALLAQKMRPGDVTVATDAFFALTEPGVTPNLFTADSDFADGLAAAAGISTPIPGATYSITVTLKVSGVSLSLNFHPAF